MAGMRNQELKSSTSTNLRLLPALEPDNPPVCKACQSVTEPVLDGHGAKRYDCPKCKFRFDLSRLPSSLETIGLTPDFLGTRGDHGAASGPKVLEQLKRCGQTGAKLRCSSCEAFTYVPFRCGSRICSDCAKHQANKLYFDIRQKVENLGNQDGYRLRHLVLTIKSSGKWNSNEIEQGLKRLAKSLPIFYRDYLRREPLGQKERELFGLKESDLIDDLSFWRKRRVLKDLQRQITNRKGQKRVLDRTGLVGAFELGPHGNVHVHCLYYGPYREQAEISAIWKKVTGNSFIVWVRPIENREKAIREITKYVVKFSEFDEEKLSELCGFLEPYRRIRTYGTFLGMKKNQEHESVCWLCGQLGSLRIEESELSVELWRIEYPAWERHRTSILIHKIHAG